MIRFYLDVEHVCRCTWYMEIRALQQVVSNPRHGVLSEVFPEELGLYMTIMVGRKQRLIDKIDLEASRE